MVASNAATFRPLFRRKALHGNLPTPLEAIKRTPQSSSGYPSIVTTKSSNLDFQEHEFNLEGQGSGLSSPKALR